MDTKWLQKKIFKMSQVKYNCKYEFLKNRLGGHYKWTIVQFINNPVFHLLEETSDN